MPDQLQPILHSFQNFTMTGDHIAEINSLAYLPFENNAEMPQPTQRLILVLVEPRLLATAGAAAAGAEFTKSLLRFKGDLRAEGLLSRFINADVYRGPVHKDGQTVLALRRFFQSVRAAFPFFEGAILIGNFPDSTLVRRVVWAPGGKLAIGTELISERTEIVLSDLSGNWENLYHQNEFNAQEIAATPDAATTAHGWLDGESVRTGPFSSTDFTISTSRSYRDAFYLDDARYSILQTTAVPHILKLQLNSAENNNEVDINDRAMINVIARPDINVSRINAYHIAVNPNPAITGTGGKTFLDAAGNPQSVDTPRELFSEPQNRTLFTFNDFELERKMLIDYFNRNHKFRNGGYSYHPFRTGVVSGTAQFPPQDYANFLNSAAADFEPGVVVPTASVAEYVRFHKTPAVLKYIMAHSNEEISEFHERFDPAAIIAEIGGVPLRWKYTAPVINTPVAGGTKSYVPSFDAQGGNTDLYVHRAMYLHGTLKDAGASIMVHGGCNVNSVRETQSEIYTSPQYAHWSNSEGILFCTNCVALMSRAKTFNDMPNGMMEGFRSGNRANFGSCLNGYFNGQAHDANLKTYNIQRKRAYFWSIIGDWTLRLRNRNGLGILKMEDKLNSIAVQPDKAWMGVWNFEAAVNNIRAIGDMDGDGIDEFVITSEWGIGIIKYDGAQFRTLIAAPRDSWFSGWRYDATINSGRDKILGVQNYAGTGKSEILIKSSWGIALLGYNGTGLTAEKLHANNTWFGGWRLNTADNTYYGNGDFDGDFRKDIVLMSPWGLGIISLQNGSSLFIAANGTRLGEWVLNSATDKILQIADFDGDGKDEILISSPWGIGVLRLRGGALSSVAMHPNGDHLSGYIVHNTHRFSVADNFRGGAGFAVIVQDTAGFHVLTLIGSRLTQTAFAANGTWVDGWRINTSDNVLQKAGDMNGDGCAEFIIRSPWGIGVMGLTAANSFRCYTLHPYGSMLNDWHLERNDVIAGCGNLFGDGKKELIFTKP